MFYMCKVYMGKKSILKQGTLRPKWASYKLYIPFRELSLKAIPMYSGAKSEIS